MVLQAGAQLETQSQQQDHPPPGELPLPEDRESPVGEIKPPELLKALRVIESQGKLETAHRVLQVSGQIFRYAIATGRAERDPAADLRSALAPWKPKHFASITDPARVGALLLDLDDYPGSFTTRCALRLAPLVFVRPGELRKAEWGEIDFEQSLWSIPGFKMKTGKPHLVPLSEQAMEILKEIEQLTGTGQYVFAGRKPDIPMSEKTMNGALRTMGYSSKEFTPHGFRAMARTLLDEQLECRPEIIEHQLAHNVRDPLGRAYNRTKHLAERKQMMKAWADYRCPERTSATPQLSAKTRNKARRSGNPGAAGSATDTSNQNHRVLPFQHRPASQSSGSGPVSISILGCFGFNQGFPGKSGRFSQLASGLRHCVRISSQRLSSIRRLRPGRNRICHSG